MTNYQIQVKIGKKWVNQGKPLRLIDHARGFRTICADRWTRARIMRITTRIIR